ncbi:MAG: hypothetical protein KFB92_04095 [Alcanivorax sp.]|nr:MAG: hypothetical protein KFB92_04095 [Alcanivorax sp.]
MQWAVGKVPEIEIDSDRYDALQNARSILIGALAIEEKYDLLFSNYLELEKECLSYATECMVKGSLGYAGFATARQSINRRIVNLLTSTRLYIDHIQQNIKLCIEEESAFNVKSLMSEQYDNNFSYRFMEALRNYVQHCGLAIHRVSTPTRWTSQNDDGELEFGLNVFAEQNVLKESEKFKAAILKEMPEEVEIIRASRSYVGSISIVHNVLRGAIKSNVAEARKAIQVAIDEYKAVNDGCAIGLKALKYKRNEFPKDIIDYFPILLEWDDSRVELESKNREIKNLGKRFVSSGAYNKALHQTSR